MAAVILAILAGVGSSAATIRRTGQGRIFASEARGTFFRQRMGQPVLARSPESRLQYRPDSSDQPRKIVKRHKKTRVCKAFKAEYSQQLLPCLFADRSYRCYSCVPVISASLMERTLRGPPGFC